MQNPLIKTRIFTFKASFPYDKGEEAMAFITQQKGNEFYASTTVYVDGNGKLQQQTHVGRTFERALEWPISLMKFRWYYNSNVFLTDRRVDVTELER
jgi:hypothetical protein